MSSDADIEVTIFTSALGIATQERGAFLQRVCGSDVKLRRRIEALLRAHERAGEFLEKPAAGDASSDND
jgi:hypothetical protein